MGGCRCSYKTCKARTDGQTHMFHFPVFDKIRCHQWITNAMKPNFLNLMLSQLKNRVVCQHHFRDDCFMNYKREKLKNTAVPTEDGPYCAASIAIEIKPVEASKPVIPINADDIENEILNHIEKRANTSVKYGDFLISDTTELFNTTHNITGARKDEQNDGNTLKKMGGMGVCNKDNNYTIIYSNEPTAHSTPNSALNSNINTPNLRKRIQNHPEIDVPEVFGPSLYSQNTMTTEENVAHGDKPIQTNQFYSNSMPKVSIMSIEYDDAVAKKPRNALRPKSTTKVFNPDKLVKILSEKTISEPLKLEGKLEPVSPSIIVKAPARRSQRVNNWHKPQPNNDENIVKTETQNSNTVDNVQAPLILPVEYVPDPKEYIELNIPTVVDKNLNEVSLNIEEQSEIIHQNNKMQPETQTVLNDFMNQNENQTQTLKQIKDDAKPVKRTNQQGNTPRKSKKAPKSRTVKSMLPPEKLAAIEEKRKYNMKLRDVINSCIGDTVASSEAIDKALFEEIQQKLGVLPTKTVSTNANSTIAYLETRLKRMEETLLSKIDHNSYKINDLKRIIKPKFGVKSTGTQTHISEKERKHYLYKEISKYLSSSAKSTIYGELFLNTQSVNEEPSSSPRKRLRRR